MFPEVLGDHLAWLRGNNLRVSSEDGGADFAFILCGDWDLLKMFPSQCRACQPPVDEIPHAFRQWVNIKKHFAAWRGVTKTTGMAGMLRKLGIELTGRHHSGIDDCRNIAKIARYLAENGVLLTATRELPGGDVVA